MREVFVVGKGIQQGLHSTVTASDLSRLNAVGVLLVAICDNEGNARDGNAMTALLTRRGFIQAAAGVFVLGAPKSAMSEPRASVASRVLSGTRFDLEIGIVPANFTGRHRFATVANGHLPAPLLRWREGDTVTLRVRNTLRERSSIRWHGMIVPCRHGRRAWAQLRGYPARRGVRVPDMDPEHLFAKLKKQSGYFNYDKRTVGDFARDVRERGLRRTLQERRMWGVRRHPICGYS